MFKKGVITDEISQEFDEAVELALKYKLDGVEIRSVWDKGPHELTKKDIKEIKNILSGNNLEVCGISAPFYKCDIDNKNEIKEHTEILKKSIELAHSLDTGLIRGFTFWSKGSFDKNLNKIISRFEEPEKLLQKEGITLVLEFDPSVFATNAKKLVKVVTGIDSPHIKALWDPGNDINDPDGEIRYPDGYDIVKPFMVHMHLKDAVKKPDGKIDGVPIGEGQVDYKGQFRALLEDGYNGYVVLETHYRPKHDIDEKLLALPKGKNFSYLGYEATDESLDKWNKLMEEI